MHLVYIDGLIETPPDPVMEGIFDGSFYDWVYPPVEGFTQPDEVRRSVESIRTVMDFFDELQEEQGPFDGILGFSQGASLACGYLLHLNEKDAAGLCGPIKFGIFFAGGGVSDQDYAAFQAARSAESIDVDSLRSGSGGALATRKLPIPSLHVHGDMDPTKASALQMASLWESNKATIVTHPGEHCIPTDTTTVRKITAAAKSMMRGMAS